MTSRSQKWEDTSEHKEATRKLFLYGGRAFQVVGGVSAFLDAVAVLVLGSALTF